MTNVTRILAQIEKGNVSAADELLPLVYEELRKLAAARLANERPGQTLQATALVHDAYIRLVDVEKAQHWDSRGHFFAAAALVIRHILVEEARRKKRLKRGGGQHRLRLEELQLAMDVRPDQLLALDEAISELELEDPERAKVVQLRFFAGMTHEEIAIAMGFSAVTARRHWRYARAWLRQKMGAELKTDEPDRPADF